MKKHAHHILKYILIQQQSGHDRYLLYKDDYKYLECRQESYYHIYHYITPRRMITYKSYTFASK